MKSLTDQDATGDKVTSRAHELQSSETERQLYIALGRTVHPICQRPGHGRKEEAAIISLQVGILGLLPMAVHVTHHINN